MPTVKLDEIRRFMEDSLKAVGAPESEAKAHADLLMHADTVGHYSHGLNRLEFYINDCQSGACVPTAKPEILKESAATAWVDGHNALGATVGHFCMDIAIKKAKECGVGWVSAKRSNHYGMAGYWALQAEREGLIGLAFTNSSPIMVPTRSKQRALGTNPIAMAAPAGDGDKLVVDMASTTVAMGKIEVKIHKEEPLPQGWALGPDGKPTTDAKTAFQCGKLMPLGGEEKTSGYKGYALASMVEMFCSGLSGSNMTHNIRSWELTSIQGPPDLGQCFAAINPDCFAPGFTERAADCLKTWRSLEPVDPSLPVLAPGDKEHQTGKQTLAKGTVTYPQRQIEAMDTMAKRIGVKPLQLAEFIKAALFNARLNGKSLVPACSPPHGSVSLLSLTMGKVATVEALRFMTDCLKAAGAGNLPASQQAELLIQADRCGHPSHGLNRLENYVNDIIKGDCKPNNTPTVLKESQSTAWVDANCVLGATASHFGMDLAIQKAQETGIGYVAMKGSNHYGMAGFWAHKAADMGLIGFTCSNTSPLLAPTRSQKSALGTNPLSLVAPANRKLGHFYLDMATTAVAVGKIEMQRRKGQPLPSGWAQGPDGKETTDPELAIKTACLMPLGGREETAGYKGYGLAAMVDLLSGMLAGSNFGWKLRSWTDKSGGPANLGHSFMAINPECFAPCFSDRVSESIEYWRKLPATDPKLPVMAPGDKEKKAAAATDVKGTVSYVKQQIDASMALAKKLKVRPMKVENDC